MIQNLISSGGPLCIIMEYAMYGSLKDYLRTCKEKVLSSGAPLRVTNLGREESEDDSFLPGSLSEEDVCNFAYQIAEGLHHLEKLNVRLCLQCSCIHFFSSPLTCISTPALILQNTF